MKLVRSFIYSAGAILLAAALERFLIATGNARVLSWPEPMLGIPMRPAVLMVGGLELVTALICLFGKNIRLQIAWLAWLATNFIVFQIGLFWMHYHPQAACIDSLTDPLILARGTTGIIISFLPFYLLVGSYAAVFWLWIGKDWAARSVATMLGKPANTKPALVARSQKAFARTLKISCTACGGHIEFPTNFFGERIPCPHCEASIILQKSAILKMSCLACDGHIAFPAHAIGQTIQCPHCNLDIILKEPA